MNTNAQPKVYVLLFIALLGGLMVLGIWYFTKDMPCGYFDEGDEYPVIKKKKL